MRVKEQRKVKGIVFFTNYDDHNQVIDQTKVTNLVVVTGRSIIAQLLGGLTDQRPKYIAMGKGGIYLPTRPDLPQPAMDEDTGRGDKVLRVEPITSVTQPLTTAVAFHTTFHRDQVADWVDELRMLTANDTLVSRITFSKQDLTLSSITAMVDVNWEIHF